MNIIQRGLDALMQDEMDGSEMTPVSKMALGIAIILIILTTVVF